MIRLIFLTLAYDFKKELQQKSWQRQVLWFIVQSSLLVSRGCSQKAALFHSVAGVDGFKPMLFGLWDPTPYHLAKMPGRTVVLGWARCFYNVWTMNAAFRPHWSFSVQLKMSCGDRQCFSASSSAQGHKAVSRISNNRTLNTTCIIFYRHLLLQILKKRGRICSPTMRHLHHVHC